MALIKSILDIHPQIPESCFLAENSVVVGDVILGENCSVWYHAVIRGDVNAIRIGNRVNVQDGAIIHCTYKKASTTIGNNVSIGHRAIIHGCTIEDDVLVGMGAIVMDHAIIQKGSLIAAGALILENTVVESGYIYAGIPAKKIKKLSPEHFKQMIERTADNYIKYAAWQ